MVALACFEGRKEAQLLHAPLGVVPLDECGDGLADLSEVSEDAAGNDLLFESPVESLGDAVGLWLLGADSVVDGPRPTAVVSRAKLEIVLAASTPTARGGSWT
jgi:hypothetical protein